MERQSGQTFTTGSRHDLQFLSSALFTASAKSSLLLLSSGVTPAGDRRSVFIITEGQVCNHQSLSRTAEDRVWTLHGSQFLRWRWRIIPWDTSSNHQVSWRHVRSRDLVTWSDTVYIWALSRRSLVLHITAWNQTTTYQFGINVIVLLTQVLDVWGFSNSWVSITSPSNMSPQLRLCGRWFVSDQSCHHNSQNGTTSIAVFISENVNEYTRIHQQNCYMAEKEVVWGGGLVTFQVALAKRKNMWLEWKFL